MLSDSGIPVYIRPSPALFIAFERRSSEAFLRLLGCGQLRPARQAQLGVVQLHRIVLDKLLGLDQETITRLGNVSYIRDAGEATALVADGKADIAFLIKPITLDQLRDISLSGDVMPQKSTDFYPKLLSGLAIYALD